MRRRLALLFVPLALTGVVLAGCTAVTTSATEASTEDSMVIETTVTVDSDLAAAAVLAANEDYTTVGDDEWDAASAVDITLSGTTVGDDEWDAASAVDITLSGSSASSSSDAVTIDGSTVTITAAGVYRLSGDLAGSVVVAAPEDALVVLILDGASIENSAGAAIDVQTADDVAIYLESGTTNAVSDASSYADDAEANAAIYAAADLTLSGSGTLSVTGNGNDGIASSDDLVILSGTITVDASDDGLRGKDALAIEGGTVSVTAGGDGLKSDQDDDATRGYVVVTGGTVEVTAGDDGIAAATDAVVTGGTVTIEAGDGSDATLSADAAAKGISAGVVAALDGGEVTISAADDAVHSDGSIGIGGAALVLSAGDDGIHAEQTVEIRSGEVAITASYEGIEGADIAISGGTVDVTSSDDGLNAASGTSSGGMGGGMQNSGETLAISGGTLTVDADGDGLDSNGTLLISGGQTVVFGPTNSGNGALDSNGGIEVTGGTVLALGSSGMAETPETSSSQAWVAASLSGSAGTIVTITDASGTVLAEATSPKQFETVVFSSADVASGATYTFSAGGTSVSAQTGTALSGGMGGGGRRP